MRANLEKAQVISYNQKYQRKNYNYNESKGSVKYLINESVDSKEKE